MKIKRRFRKRALFVLWLLIVYFAGYMNRSQWIALTAATVLVVACFMPWIYISAVNITISGVDTEGTRFGKPAYIHFIFTTIVVLFTFTKRLWAKRFNLLFTALNFAWAIKNFITVSRCEAGDCPQKQLGIFLVFIASTVLLVTAFFPGMPIAAANNSKEKE